MSQSYARFGRVAQEAGFQGSPRFGDGQMFYSSDGLGGTMRQPPGSGGTLVQNRTSEVEEVQSKELALAEMRQGMYNEKEANWSTVFPIMALARQFGFYLLIITFWMHFK